MLSKSAFPSKTPQKYLTRQLRSLKILIAKVKRDEREIFPTALIYLKTSKFSKFSKLPKFPNFPIFLNHAKTKLSTPLYFFFFSCWPLMSQSLWYSGLRPAPLPPAQPLSLSTTGLNILCVQNYLLFLKWGGGVSKWVLWGRTVLGVMPPVHVQGPVCPDHVAASAWLPVSWLCRFGCPPVQWCPVGRSPPCVGSIPEQWMITPNTPGMV